MEDNNKDKDQETTPTTSAAPTSSTPSNTVIPPKQLREDIVQSAVNFLNHPKVKASSLNQKVLFLQKKGLTQEEIEEAVRRSNNTPQTQTQQVTSPVGQPQTQYTQQAQQQQIQPVYPPPNYQLVPIQPQPQNWYGGRLGMAIAAAGCISLGAGITWLAKKYLFRDAEEEQAKQKRYEEEQEKRKKDEELRQANMKTLEELTNALKSLQSQQTELKDAIKGLTLSNYGTTKVGAAALPVDNATKGMILEMQSQINILRAQLVDMKASASWTPPVSTSTSSTISKPSSSTWSPVSMPRSIPSWQQSEETTPTNTTTTATTTTTSSKSNEIKDEAPYPTDFAKIMQMVANGQTPPDVRDINDKPIDPNAKIESGSREPREKPWNTKPFPADTNEEVNNQTEESTVTKS